MENSNKKAPADEISWAASQKKPKLKAGLESLSKNENISFWNDVPSFHASLDQNCIQLPDNKFIIEKVEVDSRKRKILHGLCQIAVVSGMFAESDFRIGQQVTVLPCLCCIREPAVEHSFSGDDFVFDSSDRADDTFGAGKTVFYVDDDRNLILIEDDLLTVTSFCTALQCINSPLIQSRVANLSFDFGHPSLVLGTLIHMLIESVLIAKKYTFTFLVSEARRIIRENILLLYSCNISDKEALNEILKNIKNIIKLVDQNFNIDKVESRVFSTVYGLKGNIDCLGSALVIEIKTGKYMSVEHRAQAILYTLLMIENELEHEFTTNSQFITECCLTLTGRSTKIHEVRSKANYVPLLYYVKSGEFVRINVQHQELSHLLKIRNDIACNDGLVECECQENAPCKIMGVIQRLPDSHFLRRQLDGIELEAGRDKAYFKAKTVSQTKEKVHLSVADHVLVNEFVYFYTMNHKFVTLGVVEKQLSGDIWITLREDIKLDRNVLICLDSDSNSFKFMRWSLLNIAYPKFAGRSTPGSGVDSFLLPGQKYGLGPEVDDACSVATSDIEMSSIDLSIDLGSSEERQPLRQKNTVPAASKPSCADEPTPSCSAYTYSDVCTSTDLLQVSNTCDELLLEKMCSTDGTHNQCDKPPVLFNEIAEPLPVHYFTPPSIFQNYKFIIPEKFRSEFQVLNADQKRALFLALNCENYMIIHGMPGTGKSTVISLLIRILLSYGKKVLLICYTHLAIQNIMDRIGDVRSYWAKKMSLEFKNSGEAMRYFNEIDLVTGTCYSFNDIVYLNRKFDYCVIDEGSQMHLLLALIPVSLSKRFCIVGDHLQLKPLTRKSREIGLSLFEHLIDHCTILKTQYRMGDEIMRLSNELFYDGQLVGFGGVSTVSFVDTEGLDVASYVRDADNCVILCYFNAKVREISALNKGVKVTTIDRFQGSEHDNVVVVFDPVEVCEVIESKERLNVALTRAKKSLTLVGNRRRMGEIALFRRLLELIE